MSGTEDESELTYNRSDLAREYGVSLVTVDNWVRRGCPHERRRNGRSDYLFRLHEVAQWRARQLAEDSQRRGKGRFLIPDAAAEWLTSLMMGFAQPFWWNVDLHGGTRARSQWPSTS